MIGTVKQFKDILDEMKTIYNYNDAKTRLSTHNTLSIGMYDSLEITTVDEKTGVTITMAKHVERGAENETIT